MKGSATAFLHAVFKRKERIALYVVVIDKGWLNGYGARSSGRTPPSGNTPHSAYPGAVQVLSLMKIR
jgi:hypothetical protein